MAEPRTLIEYLQHWSTTIPDKPAIHGKDPRGQWVTYTWSEYWTAVRETAKGLIALGHEPGQCVSIVGANRPEWVICQFAIAAARGVPAPSYPTNTPEQVAHILRNSEANIAIADTKALVDRFREACELDENLELGHYITMLDGEDADAMGLGALRALGREQPDDEIDARVANVSEEDVCVLIYTSGTTGVSKGVMLDHANCVAMLQSLMEHTGTFAEPEDFRSVSYLPLCHVAEQLLTNFLQMGTGGQVYFCADLAELKDHLVEVRPTLFGAVPRVWEKFQAALEAQLSQASGLKAKLVKWARATELEAMEADLAAGTVTSSFKRNLANKLVISKVKGALGLDCLEMAGTAAAPISVGTLRFFASLGVPIHEAYGMSETSGIATLNPIGKTKFGTVGTPVPGVEVQIAEDGEIICRGATMTKGYLRMPEKTAELIGEDGWIHTGDLGEFDDDGYLKITGRKKDILITAGGKNVAPAEMEGHIAPITGVGQVIVVGDRQPYLSALITLDVENLDALAAAAGASGSTLSDLASDPKVREYLQAQIDEHCNTKVARYQTIKRISILPVEFSVDGGELTPTMKLKRNVVAKKYNGQIDALYAE